jgi:hypothetical protein
MKPLTKKEILEKMKVQWPDWDRGSHKEILQDVIDLKMMLFVDKFSSYNWQEQDAILSVLQAIRGVD